MPVGTSEGKYYENEIDHMLDPIGGNEPYDDTPTMAARNRNPDTFSTLKYEEKRMEGDLAKSTEAEDYSNWQNTLDEIDQSFMPISQKIPIIRPEGTSNEDTSGLPRFTVSPKPKEEGNIDLTTRPIVRNEDGSISTVRSLGVNIDGKETLIPTVAHNGSRILSNEEAIQQYKDTGLHLGKFDTPEQASAYAEQLHKDQEALYAKPMDEPFKNEQEKRGVWNALTGADGKDRYQTWPEKTVRDMIDAFKLPGDVFTGETKLPSKAGVPGSAEATGPEGKALGRVAELAGAMIFGPAPIANKVVDGTLGSIAGISAKTADHGLLDTARVLDKRGYTSDEIFQTTGWFKGFDGKWKFEIPTDNITMSKSWDDLISKVDNGKVTGFSTYLGQEFNFPELYRAYPGLDMMKVHWDPKTNYFAYHQPSGVEGELGHIGLGTDFVKAPKDQQIDTLLHEIQHAIQHQEGFDIGRGGSKHQIEALRSAIKDKINSLKTPEEIADFTARMKPLAKEVKKKYGDELGAALYQRDPAEQEARIVPARRTWGPEDRAEMSPVTHQRHLEREFGDAEGIRIAPYNPTVSPSEITQLRRAANDNKTLNYTDLNIMYGKASEVHGIADDALRTKIRSGQSVTKEEKAEVAELAKIRDSLYEQRQIKLNEGIDKYMDEQWDSLIKSNKEEAKKKLKESLTVITNPDK